MQSEITQLLTAINAGKTNAADKLLPLVYGELRRMAAYKMADEKNGHTLQATALVHEAWLKIAQGAQQAFSNRSHFFHAAGRAMQQILIDSARRKLTQRHGGKWEKVDLDEIPIATAAPSNELIAVGDALESLESEYVEIAAVVRLRYFVGMTIPETADALEMSPRTVNRHWTYARAWLRKAIKENVSEDLKDRR
jgi:RNA polymerase sigma factor (TIGR02999 family)